MKRNAIFWGVLLIALGGLLFLSALGIVLPGGLRPRELFWPLFLLLLGGWLVLDVLMSRPPAGRRELAIELRDARRASVRLGHGAGRLDLTGGATAGRLLEGTFLEGVEHEVRYEGDRVRLHLRPPDRGPISIGQGVPNDWALRLSEAIPLELTFHTGASEAHLDLSALQVEDLTLNTGASSTVLTLPARGRMTASIRAGAASLEVIVPAGMAARLRIRSGVGSVGVDHTRFPRQGDVYQSPDYEQAADRAEITIVAGVGSVTIR